MAYHHSLVDLGHVSLISLLYIHQRCPLPNWHHQYVEFCPPQMVPFARSFCLGQLESVRGRPTAVLRYALITSTCLIRSECQSIVAVTWVFRCLQLHSSKDTASSSNACPFRQNLFLVKLKSHGLITCYLEVYTVGQDITMEFAPIFISSI